MNMKLRNIPFSPPDMSDAEVEQVAEALQSGWITTGPKTKEFEKLIALVCSSQKVVCLNSATAAMEMALRLIGVYGYGISNAACGMQGGDGGLAEGSSGDGL